MKKLVKISGKALWRLIIVGIVLLLWLGLDMIRWNNTVIDFEKYLSDYQNVANAALRQAPTRGGQEVILSLGYEKGHILYGRNGGIGLSDEERKSLETISEKSLRNSHMAYISMEDGFLTFDNESALTLPLVYSYEGEKPERGYPEHAGWAHYFRKAANGVDGWYYMVRDPDKKENIFSDIDQVFADIEKAFLNTGSDRPNQGTAPKDSGPFLTIRGKGQAYTAELDDEGIRGHKITVYDGGKIIQEMMIDYGPSDGYSDVYSWDVNVDGFPDLVARTQKPSDLNPMHEFYVWDPGQAGFVKVKKRGFGTVPYYKVCGGHLETYLFTSSGSREDQVLKWEGNTLEFKPKELDIFPDAGSDMGTGGDNPFLTIGSKKTGYTVELQDEGQGYKITVYDGNVVTQELMIDHAPSDDGMDIGSLDVNSDGLPDLVARASEDPDANAIYEFYVWDPELEGFAKVEKIGFEMVSYFEIYDGYIATWITTSPSSSKKQVLRWEGNALVFDYETLFYE
jgi:hypothetical protein